MYPLVEAKRHEAIALCRNRGVRRLELFGSAARDDLDEAHTDLDFLVQQACMAVRDFIGSVDLAGYEANAMMRSAVERLLQNIGEAASQYRSSTPSGGSHSRFTGRSSAFGASWRTATPG